MTHQLPRPNEPPFPPHAAAPSAGTCRRLDGNNLNGNALEQLATGLPYLTDLALRNNELNQLPDQQLFAGRSWERLDLRHNELKYEGSDGAAAGSWVCPSPPCRA